MRLAQKVILITGAASGIGAAISRVFAREGAHLALADINSEGAALAASLDARFYPLDVSRAASWQTVLDTIETDFGRLDGLVNSAGIALFKSIEDTSLEEWQQVLSVNLDGVFLGCKTALPLMKASGGGSIINISSVSGLVGGHNLAAYNASKGGVRLLSKSVALHCARQAYNIRCNSVHPSFVDTPMVRDLINASRDPDKLEQSFKRQIPLGRLGTPSDVAELALYLASDEASFVTGSEFVIDGGMTA
jgi:NAD(P)-dependent dehydrogenase (short-subunit alcohol dehydrogenase family)